MEKVINEWIQNVDDTSKQEILSYNKKELSDAFYKDISFGTAGMRGIMGMGPNRMNIYTIRKASYGYGKYLLSICSNPQVILTRDNRKNGEKFLFESMKVLTHLGIKCWYFKEGNPTPLLSFAISHLNMTGGIMITASHNGPSYNGFKVYDDKGCQLTPDKIKIVIDNIENIDSIFDIKVKNGKMNIVSNKVIDEYIEKVKTIRINKESDLKIVFTPVHGVSGSINKRVLEEEGFDVIIVKEQFQPNALFPTIKYPNPEDKRSFELAIKYLEKEKADIAIVVDPDGDRLGVAIKQNNKIHFLTGNELGILFIDYLKKEKKISESSYIVNTIVTSSFSNNTFTNTLETFTGFKYIGSIIEKLKQDKKDFILGYEESYGYSFADFVRDKDATQGVLMAAEMAAYYKKQNITLIDALERVYKDNGYYIIKTIPIAFLGQKGRKNINKIMKFFRNYNKTEIFSKNIKNKIDYKKEDLIVYNVNFGKEDVIKFTFDSGSWVILRPSGTEPKIKIYIEGISDNRKDATLEVEYLERSFRQIIENKILK